jgi:hypothetical protein
MFFKILKELGVIGRVLEARKKGAVIMRIEFLEDKLENTSMENIIDHLSEFVFLFGLKLKRGETYFDTGDVN